MQNNTKELKISKARKRLYFLLCFSPLFSFVVIKPEWVARLVAVEGFILFASAIPFWYGFNPKTNFIWKRSKWARQTERTQRFGQRLFRMLTILFGCFILWFITVPVTNDCIRVIREGEKCLIHLQGQVTGDTFRFGTYFFYQSIYISENGQPTGIPYGALFFPRYLGDRGQLQRFLITPKSQLVLQCDPVNDMQFQPFNLQTFNLPTFKLSDLFDFSDLSDIPTLLYRIIWRPENIRTKWSVNARTIRHSIRP